eukprot:TRINITY_DN8613_c0_g1_i1.p1 TRINITY_DN8613_c0_g1~~TRINITY_DN8613_c0_g1_i1.p1  ORF type:complete len:255 (-),score=80.87 TRINITY_DN8613_c0_g1_i1:147-911(-)
MCIRDRYMGHQLSSLTTANHEVLFSHFINFKTSAVVAEYFLESVLDKRWSEALICLGMLLDLNKERKEQYYNRLATQMIRVLVYRIQTAIGEARTRKDWPTWVELCLGQALFAKKFIEENDPHLLQARVNMTDEVKFATETQSLDEESKKIVQECEAIVQGKNEAAFKTQFDQFFSRKIKELDDRQLKLHHEFDPFTWIVSSPFQNISDHIVELFEKVRKDLGAWIHVFEEVNRKKIPLFFDERIARNIDSPLE